MKMQWQHRAVTKPHVLGVTWSWPLVHHSALQMVICSVLYPGFSGVVTMGYNHIGSGEGPLGLSSDILKKGIKVPMSTCSTSGRTALSVIYLKGAASQVVWLGEHRGPEGAKCAFCVGARGGSRNQMTFNPL